MPLVLNLFWVIWNGMEGREEEEKSVKGGPSGALQGKYEPSLNIRWRMWIVD